MSKQIQDNYLRTHKPFFFEFQLYLRHSFEYLCNLYCFQKLFHQDYLRYNFQSHLQFGQCSTSLLLSYSLHLQNNFDQSEMLLLNFYLGLVGKQKSQNPIFLNKTYKVHFLAVELNNFELFVSEFVSGLQHLKDLMQHLQKCSYLIQVNKKLKNYYNRGIFYFNYKFYKSGRLSEIWLDNKNFDNLEWQYLLNYQFCCNDNKYFNANKNFCIDFVVYLLIQKGFELLFVHNDKFDLQQEVERKIGLQRSDYIAYSSQSLPIPHQKQMYCQSIQSFCYKTAVNIIQRAKREGLQQPQVIESNCLQISYKYCQSKISNFYYNRRQFSIQPFQIHKLFYILFVSIDITQRMVFTEEQNITQQSFMIHKHTFTAEERRDQTNQLIKRSIQKGRQTRFHFQRVLNFDYCLLLFSIVSIVLTIFYSDADYDNKTNIAQLCLIFTFVLMIIQIVVTIYRYKAQVDLQKSQKVLDQEETIFTSGKIINIGIQIFILMLQPYPFINDLTFTTQDLYDNFNFNFKVNYVLVITSFFKLFIILRVVLIKQIYMSPRSNRLCRMYGCQSNYLYAIKCLFKDSPMALIGIVFVSSIIIFAICLRISERNLVVQYPLNKNGRVYPGDIQNFQNAVWLTIITMTTVGYGDFFPRTSFGRIIDVVLVIWGTFIVSLMVVVLTNTLNMDQSEKRALIVLNRLQAKKALKQSAAFLITHSCKKYLLRKKIARNQKAPLSEQQKAKMQNIFYKHLTTFQNVHRVIRSMYQIDDVYEEMSRQFEFINDQVNFLINSQTQTIQNLRSYLDKDTKNVTK